MNTIDIETGVKNTNMKTNKENIMSKDKQFTIEERFDFLSNLIKMVANGEANSLIVLGEGGLGKTFTVNETLKECKLRPEDVFRAKGFTTPRGLYELLYDNNGKLIVMDDFDAVFDKSDSLNVLKAALDSYDQRFITWSSKSLKNDKYPKQFEFTGRIIFISNRKRESIDGPTLSRCFKVDLEMTNDEKIERMNLIIEDLCDRNRFDIFTGIEAIEFITENKEKIDKLNIRTLLDVMRIIKNAGDSDWTPLAKYTIFDGQK